MINGAEVNNVLIPYLNFIGDYRAPIKESHFAVSLLVHEPESSGR